MRETFTSLLQATQDFCVDDTTTTVTGLSTTSAFLTRSINSTIKDLFVLLKKYSLQPLPKTASTVANQIWYHNPPGLSKIETITIPLGTLVFPLRVIQSQEEWDRLHIVPIVSNYPEAVFPRRDDFGIFPTPQTAVTMTITGNYQPTNISAADYSANTVTTAQNSLTVTGSSTNFTSSMIGRFFVLTDTNGFPTGNWYRISAVPDTTTLTLESYFEETGQSGATYLIGDSPNCPEELQEFIPYRAASIYYANRRRDLEQAQKLLNFYYTGDFDNNARRGNIRGGVLAVLKDLQERGRGNSQITDMAGAGRPPQLAGGVWSTVISAAP